MRFLECFEEGGRRARVPSNWNTSPASTSTPRGATATRAIIILWEFQVATQCEIPGAAARYHRCGGHRSLQWPHPSGVRRDWRGLQPMELRWVWRGHGRIRGVRVASDRARGRMRLACHQGTPCLGTPPLLRRTHLTRATESSPSRSPARTAKHRRRWRTAAIRSGAPPRRRRLGLCRLRGPTPAQVELLRALLHRWVSDHTPLATHQGWAAYRLASLLGKRFGQGQASPPRAAQARQARQSSLLVSTHTLASKPGEPGKPGQARQARQAPPGKPGESRQAAQRASWHTRQARQGKLAVRQGFLASFFFGTARQALAHTERWQGKARQTHDVSWSG
eukprot:gene22856-biopygen16295